MKKAPLLALILILLAVFAYFKDDILDRLSQD
jgi:hypothetical protein